MKRRRWLMRAVRLLLCSGVALAAAGCGKIANPHAQERERDSLLVANYTIQAPPGVIEKLDTKASEKATKPHYQGEEVLRLLIWTNYFPPEVLEKFSELSGVTLHTSMCSSNEEILEKVERGEKYDLVMPLGYMLERLIQRNLLHKLNHANMQNLKYLDEEYRDSTFDEDNRHSIPYLWTTAGIAYNAAFMDKPPRVWGDLFTPLGARDSLLTNRVSLLPEPMEALGAALIHLGYSPNSENTNDLDAAAAFLAEQVRDYEFRFFWSALPEAMKREEILIAQAYTSEAGRAEVLNPNVLFAIPENGVWMAVDYLCIPASVSPGNKRATEALIDYLLNPSIAGKVVNYSYHASTVKDATSYVDSQIRNGPVYSHPTRSRLHARSDAALDYRERLWDKLTNTFQPPEAK